MNSENPTTTYAALIANWNGEAFIERCLGSVMAAVRRAARPIQVVVVDDASDDRSSDIVANSFPSVRLIRLRRNRGYGRAVNRAMKEIQADRVFLLNNDLAPATDFFERLIRTFDESDPERIFAVGARTLDWETHAINHGGQRAVWQRGLIVQEAFECDDAQPTDFFQAGACLVDRRRFVELGGFDPIFHPGYWEDYDVAWQALRSGWINLYEPRAVAYHCGKGSMRRRFGEFGVSLAVRRNHLLFNWINLRDGGLLTRHLIGLPGLIIRDTTESGRAGWGRALVEALVRLPRALRLRRRRLLHRGEPDRTILKTNNR